METPGFAPGKEAVLQTLTPDVLKSSEIEGEFPNREQVRSSVATAWNVGIDVARLVTAVRHVDGVVEMMLDASQHFDKPLTADRLFGRDAALFPGGLSGLRKIRIVAWRDDPTGRTL